MRNILIFCFISLTLMSYSQIQQISIEFRPSFIDHSNLLITKENDGYSMSIKHSKTNEKIMLPEVSLSELNKFLDNYILEKQLDLKEKQQLDSIKSRESNKNGIIDVSVGVDGIIVIVKISDYAKSVLFDFWSPRNGTSDKKFAMMLLDLMKKSFTNADTREYLLQQQKYF